MSEEARFCPICDHQGAEDNCPTCAVPMIKSEVLEAEEDAIIGKTFSNRYRIDKILGEGGMGRVYVATQLSIGREVALKTLHAAFVSEKRHLKRFYKEAQSASALSSPHVVRIHDFGLDEETGSPYISMEMLKGCTLGDLIEQQGPLNSRRCARIIMQVLKALLEAQQAGIVHRDLKPDNIFLVASADGDDFVKVMDFGIAKVLNSGSEEDQALTATGTTVGTPLYMSPEQILGNQVDFRADLYSLGCILHEMLTKSPPFTADERVAVMMRHMSEPAPELTNPLPCGEPLPEALRVVHQSMLAKKPDERPLTVRALLQIFQAMDRGEAIDAAAVLASAGPNVSDSGATMAGPTLGAATGNQTAPFPAPTAGRTSDINDTIAQATAARAALVGNSSAQVAVDGTVMGMSPSQEMMQAGTGLETSTDLEFGAAPAKGGKGLWVAVAAGVLLLAGGGAFLATQGNDSQTAEAGAPSADQNVDHEQALDQLKRADAVIAKMKKMKGNTGAEEKAKAAAPEPKKPEPPKEKPYIVAATPKAEVFIDGKKVGDTPYTHMMKPDASPVVIELRAKGHVAKPVVIRPDGQRDQIISLVKQAPVAKPAARPARKKRSSTKKAAAPAKAPAKKKSADTVLEPW